MEWVSVRDAQLLYMEKLLNHLAPPKRYSIFHFMIRLPNNPNISNTQQHPHAGSRFSNRRNAISASITLLPFLYKRLLIQSPKMIARKRIMVIRRASWSWGNLSSPVVAYFARVTSRHRCTTVAANRVRERWMGAGAVHEERTRFRVKLETKR